MDAAYISVSRVVIFFAPFFNEGVRQVLLVVARDQSDARAATLISRGRDRSKTSTNID